MRRHDMTAQGGPRPLMLAVLLAGMVWAVAGAATAQDLQAGQTMTQSEADRLEAVQSDLDRMEAEEADAEVRAADEIERRDRARERRRDAQEGRRDDRAAREQDAFGREWVAQWEACSARLPADQKLIVQQILKQHALSVQSLQDSAGEGANVAFAVQQQQTQTDTLLATVAGATCG